MDIETLRTALRERGSARRLAKISSVSPSVISKLLKHGLGNVRMNTVERLSRGLSQLEAERSGVGQGLVNGCPTVACGESVK